MDPSTTTNVNYRQPLNICRFCLSVGCYKDISNEYYYSGQIEVYEDMLRDSFNLEISHHDNCPSGSSRLICEVCIVRLRDAHALKQMVIHSEENFITYLQGLQNDQSIVTEPTDQDENLKLEEIKLEELPNNFDIPLKIDEQNDDLKDDDSFDDDEVLANIKLELSRAEDIETPIKTNRRLVRERKCRARGKIKGNHDTDKLSKNSKTEKDWLKIAERRGNGPLLRENSLKLLANSTICVFQWNKSRYRCFCCKEPFSDMNLLREHTNSRHSLENIEKKIIMQQNRLVKAEISVLFCKICGKQLESLNILRNHLQTHEIKFDLEEDLLVPFKIGSGSLQCQLCSQTFTMFRLLNIHMNKHFQKQVCHICGAGFSNLVFLNLHKTRSHRPLSCKHCNLVFTNKIDKKEHDINIHNVKPERKLRFPCPYCQERFFQENFRVQHLVEKHGMSKPEHRCEMCSKVFITRSLCNNHMKNVHLKEKNHECDVCHHLFYSKSDVLRHRVTHTGEKKFTCNLCNNLFATKDSLRRHMKRTHVGM